MQDRIRRHTHRLGLDQLPQPVVEFAHFHVQPARAGLVGFRPEGEAPAGHIVGEGSGGIDRAGGVLLHVGQPPVTIIIRFGHCPVGRSLLDGHTRC